MLGPVEVVAQLDAGAGAVFALNLQRRGVLYWWRPIPGVPLLKPPNIRQSKGMRGRVIFRVRFCFCFRYRICFCFRYRRAGFGDVGLSTYNVWPTTFTLAFRARQHALWLVLVRMLVLLKARDLDVTRVLDRVPDDESALL